MRKVVLSFLAGLVFLSLAGNTSAAETVTYLKTRADGLEIKIDLPVGDTTYLDKFSEKDVKLLQQMAQMLVRQVTKAEKDKSLEYYWLAPSSLWVANSKRLTAYGLAEPDIYSVPRFKALLDKTLEWSVAPLVTFAEGQEPADDTSALYYLFDRAVARCNAGEIRFKGFAFSAQAKNDRAVFIFSPQTNGKMKLAENSSLHRSSAKELRDLGEGPPVAFLHVFPMSILTDAASNKSAATAK